jgi:hypothetical protein
LILLLKCDRFKEESLEIASWMLQPGEAQVVARAFSRGAQERLHS